MLKCLYLLIVACIIIFDTAKAQYSNDSVLDAMLVSNIQLQNAATGQNFFLKETQNLKPLTLFVFLSPECPVCKNYSGMLNDVYKRYAQQVEMYGIIPGKAYSADVVRKFQQEYNLSFPLLIDNEKKLTEYLQAGVTPQVILLDNKYQLLYKGAIDNRVQSLGKQRVKATACFLQDALQQSLSKQTVLIKRTKAVGCRINDY